MSIKPRKLYKPQRAHNVAKYKMEKKLICEYGLRNKAQINKAEAKVEKYRAIAKTYTKEHPVYIASIKKLIKKGIIENENYNLLDLVITDVLERRLQRIIQLKEKISPLHSRQLIVNGHVKINNIVITRPSFYLDKDLEYTLI